MHVLSIMECAIHVGVSPLSNRREEERIGVAARAFRFMSNKVGTLGMSAKNVGEKVMKLGRDDPRRIFHAFKVGLALTIVTLFYFMRPLYDGTGGNAIWAVMTVVVVFEYTVGGTLSKGLNRAFATLLAGALALGVHYLANLSGKKAEPIIIGTAVFLLGSASTFSRFFPGIKAKYDYGVLIFILTFSLVSVSGYRVEKLFDLAQQRLSTIAVGISLCVIVSILICPVWAGRDLHDSIVNNLKKLADSLEGCVEEYFNEREEGEGESKEDAYIQGYKVVLDSKTREESLANLARWEPAHGQFGFCHPWKQYLKIGAMTRSCAYCVEALKACIDSEYKAPKAMRLQLKTSCLKVTSLSSVVLRELSTSLDTMKRSSAIDSLIDTINEGIKELYTTLKYLPHAHRRLHYAHQAEAAGCSLALMDILPIATVASILVEVVNRIEGIIAAIDELSVHQESKHNATVESLCDKEVPHVIVAIKGSLLQSNSVELQSRTAHN